MAVNYTSARFSAEDDNGRPLSGGRLFTYQNGTTTPAVTYKDAAGTTPNTNPIILDARGEAVVFVQPAQVYTFVLKNRNDVLVWSQNDINTSDLISVIGPISLASYLTQFVEKVVDSIAELRSLSKTKNHRARVLGYYASGDGGGGSYSLSDGPDPFDDGGMNVLASDGGWWRRAPSEFVSVKTFGARGDGVANDGPAIQAAHDYIADAMESGFVVMPPSENPYKVNDPGLVFDTNKVGLEGSGAVIDGSGMTTGALLSFTQSNGDVNQRPARNRAHPLRNFTLKGPGVDVAVTGADVNDSSAVFPTVAGVTFEGVSWTNFQLGVDLRRGSYFTTFRDCDFSAYVGGTMGRCVRNIESVNSGERNVFTNTRFGSALEYFYQANGNASTFFTDCSFNYGTRMLTVEGGTVNVKGGHVESGVDNEYWFHVSGDNSLLTMTGFDIIVAHDKVNVPIYFSAPSAVNGGVVVRDVRLASISPYMVPLVGGTGRTVVQAMSTFVNGASPHIGQGANLLAYGGFEPTYSLEEWTTGGTVALSTEFPKTGTRSMLLTGQNGVTAFATFNAPCSPGQKISTTFWYALTGFTGPTNGTFAATCGYLDKTNRQIGTSSSLVSTSTSSGYLRAISQFPYSAPPGAAKAFLSFQLFGVDVAGGRAFVDDVIVNLD